MTRVSRTLRIAGAASAVLSVSAVAIVVLSTTLSATSPPHIFLTYSGALETTIDVNVFTHVEAAAFDVYYDTQSREGDVRRYAHQVSAVQIPVLLQHSDGRNLYVAPLNGLQPDTTYYFCVAGERGSLTNEKKFRTLPGGDHPVRFINGGDMGTNDRAIRLLKLAAAEDPDFALIGGDFAYENGELTEFRRWDRWLTNWENYMVTTDGRMIPIIGIVGNHETNEYQFQSDEPRAPWYVGFFGRQSEQIYYSRPIGDRMVVFLLDSGHLTPYGGEQTMWLDRELEKFKDIPYKLAAYHVPLYPAHNAYDTVKSTAGRELWGPFFDKYRLTIAFEHHDHVLKRSKPLKNNEVAADGTIYVGNGCFGQEPRTIDPQTRWYNEIEKSAAHFWLVTLDDHGLHLEAIDDTGDTLDRFALLETSEGRFGP